MANMIDGIFAFLLNFHQDREAATIVEYSILIALIAAVCFVAISLVGFEAADYWNASATQMGAAVSESVNSSNLQ